MGERDEVFKLRLYNLVHPLSLVCDRIVSYIPFTIDLEGQRVARGGLRQEFVLSKGDLWIK